MEMRKSRVYVLTDEAGRIIQIEGEYSLSNIQNMAEWTLIEEGPPCDRLNHAQNMYLDGGLCTSDLIPRYKLVDNKPVLRTDEEIEADRATIPAPPPAVSEDTMGLLVDQEYRLTLLELGITNKME